MFKNIINQINVDIVYYLIDNINENSNLYNKLVLQYDIVDINPKIEKIDNKIKNLNNLLAL